MAIRWVRGLAWALFLILLGMLLFFLYKKGAFFGGPSESPEKAGQETGISDKKIIPVDVRLKEDLSAYGEALKEGSEEACLKIQFDPALRQKCLDSVRQAGILARRNVEECEQLSSPETKQFCIDKITLLKAVDGLEAALCEKISDEKLKTECLDQVNVFANANQQTLESCAAIQNETLHQTCLDQVYYRAGVDKKEASDCSRIENTTLKDRCMKVVAKTPATDAAGKLKVSEYLTTEEQVKVCQVLSGEDQSKCKDDANYQLAFNKKDLAYCNQIEDPALKSKCQNDQAGNINRYYLRLAVAKKDPSLCQKILREDARNACLNYVR